MSKPPFGPKVAGRIASFFGPIAGAMVSVVSLRRMGCPLKARKIQRWTLAGAALFAVVLCLIPDALARLVTLPAEIAFYLIYPRLQETEFANWQSANPDMQPANGWGALGWAFAGLLLFMVIGFSISFALILLFPRLG